jgi:prepilin-type N-terminal cleavage/methylation domain-containing protein
MQIEEIYRAMIMKYQKGFTLIEMLIVIAIIGILASIVLVGLGPVQKSARDARRISDLRQVQTALEICFTKAGQYPAAGNWASLGTALAAATCANVKTIPNDPRPTQSYEYGVNATRDAYVLAATLEDTGNGALQTDVDSTVYGVDCGPAAFPESPAKYCVEF